MLKKPQFVIFLGLRGRSLALSKKRPKGLLGGCSDIIKHDILET